MHRSICSKFLSCYLLSILWVALPAESKTHPKTASRSVTIPQGKPVHIDVDARSVIADLTKKYRINPESLSMKISVGQGESMSSIFELNERKQLIPASISKIATTATFLKSYPPGTQFRTQILLAQEPRGESYSGDVYLRGGGDPSFVSENMWYLVNVFLRSGIKKINGNIIVDDSLFDEARFDESRESVRVDRAYDAPVGAMSFNWNSINIFVRPIPGESRAQVVLDPENNYVQLINRVKIVSGTNNSLIAERIDDKKNGHDVIQVSGSLGSGNSAPFHEVVVFKNITRPNIWSGENLRSFLQQRGIQVSGEVRSGLTPSNAILIAESASKPVENIVTDMNKFSNNFVAEMLCKHLGLLKAKPGTIANGVEVIRDYLRTLGLTDQDVKIINPSGLTRDNRASAFGIWRILQQMREDFSIQPESMISLPIAGVDGTLKKRMKGTAGERSVRGKTGYLDNVVSLAGYAGAKNKEVMTYAFIYNGSVDEAKVREFFDAVLVSLVQ